MKDQKKDQVIELDIKKGIFKENINELFFLIVHTPPDKSPNLLGDIKTKSVMVWDSFEMMKQSVIRTAGMLGMFYPWPVRVTSERFKGINDYYIDDFIVYVQDLENKSSLKYKVINDSTLIFPVTERIREFKMVNINGEIE